MINAGKFTTQGNQNRSCNQVKHKQNQDLGSLLVKS